MIKSVMTFSIVFSLLLLCTCQITWAGQEEETNPSTTPSVPVPSTSESKDVTDAQTENKPVDVFYGMATLGFPIETPFGNCAIL